MKNFLLSLVIFISLLSLNVMASDGPASGCQIYVTKIAPWTGSHASGHVLVFVKVGWIGNGETIKLVGFYESNVGFFYPTTAFNGQTSYGEYAFLFPVLGGDYSKMTKTWKGAFFVQTNKNTYWLNPNLDRNQSFQFGPDFYNFLVHNQNPINTIGNPQGGYNPLSCR